MFQMLKVCLCQKKEQFQMIQSKARRKEDHWQSREGGQIIEGGAVSGVGKWVMPMSRWHRLPLFVFLRNGTEKGAGWVPASGLWHRAVALRTSGGNIDSWGRGREMKFEGAKKSGDGKKGREMAKVWKPWSDLSIPAVWCPSDPATGLLMRLGTQSITTRAQYTIDVVYSTLEKHKSTSDKSWYKGFMLLTALWGKTLPQYYTNTGFPEAKSEQSTRLSGTREKQ